MYLYVSVAYAQNWNLKGYISIGIHATKIKQFHTQIV